MTSRFDCLRASSSASSGIYRYHGDPVKFAIRLMIEKDEPHQQEVPIDLAGHAVSPDLKKEPSQLLSPSTTTDENSSKSLICNTSFRDQDKFVEYIIRWNSTYPTVEKILSTNDGGINIIRDSDSFITRDYKLVAKIVNYKQHLSSFHGQSDNYSLHQPVKWNNASLFIPSESSLYYDSSSIFYNHLQNSTFIHYNNTNKRDTKNNSNTISNHNIQASTNNFERFKAMYIFLERVPGSSTFINVNQSSPTSSSVASKQSDRNNTSFYNTALNSDQHILGIVTLDELSRLITIKPDFDKHLNIGKSWKYNFPKFTYSFRIANIDNNGNICASTISTVSPIEAEINLTRNVLRPQLNQNHRPSCRSKKVFSSPINGSALTFIQLEIQYAHSLASKSLDNLHVRYRLFRPPWGDERKIGDREGRTGYSDDKKTVAGDKHSSIFKNLYLDSKTVTTLPNSSGRFHFSSIEQLLIKSKRIVHDNNQQKQDINREQQLHLLMEFYSGDFFREKFEGWAFVILPKSCSKKIIEIDIINYDLYRIIDRIRYHLTGTLPCGIGDIEDVVSKSRYLLPTRFSGKIVLSFEAVQQVSDPDLDKATIELLKISDTETRMVKIDIESVIQAYKLARKKLEALEC